MSELTVAAMMPPIMVRRTIGRMIEPATLLQDRPVTINFRIVLQLCLNFTIPAPQETYLLLSLAQA
jgi:hypothetical protein